MDDELIDMCREVAQFEGSELGDAIEGLLATATILYGISCDEESKNLFDMAKNLSKEFVEQAIDEGYPQLSSWIIDYFTKENN